MFVVLVTGGAGFIGSHIVDKLIEEGNRVIVVDNLSTGKIGYVNKEAFFYRADIRDENLSAIFRKEKPDFVIHQAAQIDVQRSMKDPVFDGDVNILGTINILECCKEFNVKKIIYASSAAVYGNPEYLGIDEEHKTNPISYYGISKLVPELYIKVYSQLYELKYTILRYANVYGIRQDPKGEGGVISAFMDIMFKEKRPAIFGDGRQTRDFVYVEDVARANILSLYKGDNDIFNIGTGVKISINELFKTMKNIIGVNVSPIYSDPREGDILHSYFDNSKAKEILGWMSKYTLEEGLEETIEYYKNKYQTNEVAATKEI